MLDLRTLLLLLAAADMMLAASLWLGASHRSRDGMSHWAGSLVVRALGVGLLAWQGSQAGGALAIGTALLALSMTLQAGALLAYDNKSLPAWVHTAVIAAIAVPFQLLEQDRASGVLFGGIVFGTLLLGIAGIGAQLHAPAASRARAIVVASFAAAGLACFFRGVGAMVVADPLSGFRVPMGFAAATFIFAFAAAVAASFGFLLLHRERAEGEARRLATIDPLTGCYNRTTFHEIAERELSRARRAGQPLSIVMLDIDHFRAINEQHGHRVGDEVLRKFGDLVRSALRQEDMVVRFGGEEFLVMLPDVPGPGAVVVAGRIRRYVANEPIEAAGHKFAVTVSLGVAARLDEGPESIDTLLDRADSALRLAKERGRNRVVALSLGRSIAA
ncbi:MAG TPA: GGDEF domain-containing protein [Usitatibacter sp.]|nr:GGDEF domain-containing protein [Usitatibacter sp.]